ncbi:hypothetical protein D3C72_2275720 [compost metagenome]
MRGATHRLRHAFFKALERKQKIPGQKTLLPLHHAAGDHKTRLLQRLEHVRKNGLDGGHAQHFVERVLEASLRRIELADGDQVCR